MFRKFYGVVAGLVAVAIVGCNAPLPTDPSAVTMAPPAASNLSIPLGALLPVLKCVGLPDSISINIGPNGGSISLGGSSLVIPRGSLKAQVRISMLPVLGKPGAVQFFPHGLVFNANAPPTLTLDTDCIGNPANPYIVYTDDQGHVLERLPVKSKTAHSVTADLHHFSRYAVAW